MPNRRSHPMSRPAPQQQIVSLPQSSGTGHAGTTASPVGDSSTSVSQPELLEQLKQRLIKNRQQQQLESPDHQGAPSQQQQQQGRNRLTLSQSIVLMPTKRKATTHHSEAKKKAETQWTSSPILGRKQRLATLPGDKPRRSPMKQMHPMEKNQTRMDHSSTTDSTIEGVEDIHPGVALGLDGSERPVDRAVVSGQSRDDGNPTATSLHGAFTSMFDGSKPSTPFLSRPVSASTVARSTGADDTLAPISSVVPSNPIGSPHWRTPPLVESHLSSPASSILIAPTLSLLSGARDSLYPVPQFSRPPLGLSVNSSNPLLSEGLASVGDHFLCGLEPSESPASYTPLSRLDHMLLTIQSLDALRASALSQTTVISTSPVERFQTSKPLLGLLASMCSYDEMLDKQRTSTASDFERLPATLQTDVDARLVNRYLVVRSFQRSDANKVFKPEDVRPLVWCRKSVHNLLALHLSADCADLPWHIYKAAVPATRLASIADWKDFSSTKQAQTIKLKNHGFSFLDVYNFLRDRFRSIWQDLTVQHCSKHRGYIESLEITFRFLILSEALLCGTPSFDSFQNGELVNTSLDKLISGYQDARYTFTTMSVHEESHDPDIKTLLNVLVYKSPYEAEFWAYRIITTLPHSLDNSNALLDTLRKIPSELISDRRIQLALRAHSAFRDRNSVRYFKIFKKADFLMAVLLQQYAHLLRVVFLKVLMPQFSSRHPTMPFKKFCHQLGFDGEALETIRLFCSKFNIAITTIPFDGLPAAVNLQRINISPSDLHPKKSGSTRFQSLHLQQKWKQLGITRQTLLDPEFPTSAVFQAVLSTQGFGPTLTSNDEATQETFIDYGAKAYTEPNHFLIKGPTAEPVPFPGSANQPNPVQTASLSSTLSSTFGQLSPFGAALVGLPSPSPLPKISSLPVSSRLFFPTSSSAEPSSLGAPDKVPALPFTGPATSKVLFPSSAPSSGLFPQSPVSSSTSSSLPIPSLLCEEKPKRLSFAFEGLVTSTAARQEDEEVQLFGDGRFSRSSGDRRRNEDVPPHEPRFGLSDSEVSDTGVVQLPSPVPDHQEQAVEAAFGLLSHDQSFSSGEQQEQQQQQQQKQLFKQPGVPGLAALASGVSIVSGPTTSVQTGPSVPQAKPEPVPPFRPSVVSRTPKRPRDDSIGLTSTSDFSEGPDGDDSAHLSSIVVGAKRRLRGSFDSRAGDPSLLVLSNACPQPCDTDVLALTTSHPVITSEKHAVRAPCRQKHSVTVTSCLNDVELRANSSEVIDVRGTLGFQFNENEFTDSILKPASELLVEALESVLWSITLASAECLVAPPGDLAQEQDNDHNNTSNNNQRRQQQQQSQCIQSACCSSASAARFVPHSRDGGFTNTTDGSPIRFTVERRHVSEDVPRLFRRPIIPGPSLAHGNSAVGSKWRATRRWRSEQSISSRLSDRFAALFSSRHKRRSRSIVFPNNDLDDDADDRVRPSSLEHCGSFGRRFLELVFLQLTGMMHFISKSDPHQTETRTLGSGHLRKFTPTASLLLPPSSNLQSNNIAYSVSVDSKFRLPSASSTTDEDNVTSSATTVTNCASDPGGRVSHSVSGSSDAVRDSKRPSQPSNLVPAELDLRCYFPLSSDALEIQYPHPSYPSSRHSRLLGTKTTEQQLGHPAASMVDDDGGNLSRSRLDLHHYHSLSSSPHSLSAVDHGEQLLVATSNSPFPAVLDVTIDSTLHDRHLKQQLATSLFDDDDDTSSTDGNDVHCEGSSARQGPTRRIEMTEEDGRDGRIIQPLLFWIISQPVIWHSHSPSAFSTTHQDFTGPVYCRNHEDDDGTFALEEDGDDVYVPYNSTWIHEAKALQAFIAGYDHWRKVNVMGDMGLHVVVLFSLGGSCGPTIRKEVRNIEEAVHRSLSVAWGRVASQEGQGQGSGTGAAGGDDRSCGSGRRPRANMDVIRDRGNPGSKGIGERWDYRGGVGRSNEDDAESRRNGFRHSRHAVVPWDFGPALDRHSMVDEGKQHPPQQHTTVSRPSSITSLYHRSTIACYCVAHLGQPWESRTVAPIQQPQRSTWHDSFVNENLRTTDRNNSFRPVKQSIYDRIIQISKRWMKNALSHLRYWSQLGTILHMQKIVARGRVVKEASTPLLSRHPFPEFVQLRWRECDCDSLALLLISSWKRKVEELPDFILPTTHKLFELLPVCVRELSTCVYLDPFFWNAPVSREDPISLSSMGAAGGGVEERMDNRTSVLGTFEALSRAIDASTAEMVETTEDLLASEFRSSGDFLQSTRRLIMEVVADAMSKVGLDALQSLALTLPFWREYDMRSRPSWNGLPFPHQCYGGWNALMANASSASTTTGTAMTDSAVLMDNHPSSIIKQKAVHRPMHRNTASRTGVNADDSMTLSPFSDARSPDQHHGVERSRSRHSFGTPPRGRASTDQPRAEHASSMHLQPLLGTSSPQQPRPSFNLVLLRRFGVELDPKDDGDSALARATQRIAAGNRLGATTTGGTGSGLVVPRETNVDHPKRPAIGERVSKVDWSHRQSLHRRCLMEESSSTCLASVVDSSVTRMDPSMVSSRRQLARAARPQRLPLSSPSTRPISLAVPSDSLLVTSPPRRDAYVCMRRQAKRATAEPSDASMYNVRYDHQQSHGRDWIRQPHHIQLSPTHQPRWTDPTIPRCGSPPADRSRGDDAFPFSPSSRGYYSFHKTSTSSPSSSPSLDLSYLNEDACRSLSHPQPSPASMSSSPSLSTRQQRHRQSLNIEASSPSPTPPAGVVSLPSYSSKNHILPTTKVWDPNIEVLRIPTTTTD